MTAKEFPLVLSSGMMSAASAVTEAESIRFGAPISINETFVQLVGRGLRGMLAQVELSEEVVQRSQEPLREILEFLEAHPQADRARPADFADGSKARAFIEQELRSRQEDANGAADIPEAVEGAEIARQFEQGEESLTQLRTAIDAIKIAVRAP